MAYKLIDKYRKAPIKLVGASGKLWLLGSTEPIVKKRKDGKEVVIEECPEDLYEDELISIGWAKLFEFVEDKPKPKRKKKAPTTVKKDDDSADLG